MLKLTKAISHSQKSSFENKPETRGSLNRPPYWLTVASVKIWNAAMDPFSALGLASNICQLLDFSSKLVSDTLEIYRSVDGASSVNSELQTITEDLTRFCGALAGPESRIDEQQATKSELALVPLARSCKALGEQFLSLLNSLKVKARHQKFESVRQALRSAWKEKEILDYQNRLKSFRAEIAVHLLEILRYDSVFERWAVANVIQHY